MVMFAAFYKQDYNVLKIITCSRVLNFWIADEFTPYT